MPPIRRAVDFAGLLTAGWPGASCIVTSASHAPTYFSSSLCSAVARLCGAPWDGSEAARSAVIATRQAAAAIAAAETIRGARLTENSFFPKSGAGHRRTDEEA